MKTLLPILVLFISINCEAQIRAVSEDGEEVILKNDGTWKYASFIEKIEPELVTNSVKFTKSQNANDLIKSNINSIEVHFDAKKWKYSKGKIIKSAEYQVESKSFKYLTGVLITEKTEVDILTLKKYALNNFQKLSKDSLNLIKEEFRIVNNVKVIFLRFSLIAEKDIINYWTYIFSNNDGSTQFSLATSKEITKEKENEIEELLNGITITLK